MGVSEGNLSNVSDGGKWPLVKLNQQIEDDIPHISLNNNGERIISGNFDCYFNN